MQINLKTTGIELTDAIRQYAEEKLDVIQKMVESDEAAMVEVEVGKTTAHHNKGPYMRCEMNLTYNGDLIRAEEEREDLYEAIDTCKDDLRRQVAEKKDRMVDERRVPRPDKE